MRREGLKISYRPDSSDGCLYIIEALVEGVVFANMVDIERRFPNFGSLVEEGIVYEMPKAVSAADQDQHVGTLSEVLAKKKATCLEATAIVAAQFRLAGKEARVELIPTKDAYGQIKPWSYHAIVRFPDGSASDPTADLQGYLPRVGGDPWWKAAGHCCGNCALGQECAGEAGGCDCGGDHGDSPSTSVGHRPRCRCRDCNLGGM